MYENQKGISISEIIKRLKLSRNYITRNITHCVRHIEKEPSKGARVIFDERELREYLKNQATFTRQTKRVNLNYEIEKYNKIHPENKIDRNNFKEFMGNVPKMSDVTRRELPPIPVKAFDFWDETLIFPKEYKIGDENSKVQNAEICYRNMFDIGAVKIQLGKQKTMFCIVNEPNVIKPNLSDIKNRNYDTMEYCLLPADWQPFYKGIAKVDDTLKKLSPFLITVKGDSEALNWHDVERALRNSLILDSIVDYEVCNGKFQVSVVARLPNQINNKQ